MFTGTLRSKQLQFRDFLGDILWATRLSRTPAWLVVLILLDTLVLTTLNAVGFSWVVRTMVNGATSGDRTAVLWALGVGLAVGVIGCLSWGIDFLSRKYQAEARALVETRAADAIIGLSPQRYLTRQAGAWLSIVHNDAAQVATLSPFTLSSFAASTVQALASLAYLAYMNPLITVMTLVFSSLLLVISLRGYPEAGKAFRAANENAEQWSGALLQALRGRVTVYLYEAESWFMSRLSACAHESVRRQIEYNNRAQAIFFSGVAAVTTAHILTFAIGGLLLFLQKIAPGDIPAYWILVSQLLWPVQSLTDRYKSVQNGVIAVRRLRSIIPEINCPGYHADEEAGDTGPREEKDAASAGPPDISLRQVTFAYGDRLVLHNVTFDIPAGQLIVIAGPNGSGKTTIIRLLAKLETGYQGGILVNGQPLERIGTANWRSQLAWVPQEDMFFNDSVEYNLTFGQETQAVALEEALVASRLDEVILRLPEGLSYVVGEAGKALSAGQRQRLAIARALLRRPRLLLVDEPTSSIDRESKEALVRALVQRKGQSTIVLVTHDPDMVRIADWIVVLDGGKVVWQGPAGEHGTQKATATVDWNA